MNRTARRLATGALVALGGFWMPHLLAADSQEGIRIAFEGSVEQFCSDGGPLETSLHEPGDEPFSTPGDAADWFLDSLRTAASVENPTLSELDPVAREQLIVELTTAYAPAKNLAAPHHTRLAGDRHHFDNRSPDGSLTVRLVVEPLQHGYFVSSAFVCTSQIVDLELADFGSQAP